MRDEWRLKEGGKRRRGGKRRKERRGAWVCQMSLYSWVVGLILRTEPQDEAERTEAQHGGDLGYLLSPPALLPFLPQEHLPC